LTLGTLGKDIGILTDFTSFTLKVKVKGQNCDNLCSKLCLKRMEAWIGRECKSG